MSSPNTIVCIGGGGHAKVVMDAIRSCPSAWHLVGYTDPNPPIPNDRNSFPYLGDDKVLEALRGDGIRFAVLGVGSVGNWTKRRDIVGSLNWLEFQWGIVKHSTSYCSQETVLGEGTVVLASAVINVGTTIGRHCIINTGAIVEHDCRLENWVHVAPGACLGGEVCLGEGTHIGLGARVREGVAIGSNVLVGLGSVVIEDIPDNVVVVGSPASILRDKAQER